MQRFNNPFMNNNFPGMNMTNNQQNNENFQMDNQQTCGCGCNNVNVEQPNFNCCQRPKCPTTYKCCPPIVTCSKQVIDQISCNKTTICSQLSYRSGSSSCNTKRIYT